jgi:hypothetical protein
MSDVTLKSGRKIELDDFVRELGELADILREDPDAIYHLHPEDSEILLKWVDAVENFRLRYMKEEKKYG